MKIRLACLFIGLVATGVGCTNDAPVWSELCRHLSSITFEDKGDVTLEEVIATCIETPPREGDCAATQAGARCLGRASDVDDISDCFSACEEAAE